MSSFTNNCRTFLTFLLSCCYELFERCLTGRIGDLIDATVPKDQAGFRKNRNCCDQVLALTNFIELDFDKELKTGVVFLDLSAAFDTVWKRGLLLKLSRIIPCRLTLRLLMNILSDRNFQVTMNGKTSRMRILNNGLPQGSVLSSFLYSLYTSDLPDTVSRKFIYADDIAIAFQSKSFEDIEAMLNADLEKLSCFFKNWRLRPNVQKTVSCVFHLNNRQANRHLNIKMDGGDVEHDKNPKYRNLESIKGKLKSRVNIVQKLAGTT